jgi:hypothetical protein
VLLPDPEGPTMAVDSPALMLKVTPSNVLLAFSRAVGYLNITFSKLIPFLISKFLRLFSLSFISGSLSMTSNTVFPMTLALKTA